MRVNQLLSFAILIGSMTGVGAVYGQGCGTSVYDTGGAGGNYGNNQNLTWTYCPPPGQVMTITFVTFNTEAGFDELSIHNGPTNASPQVGGVYSGTTLPPSFTGPVGGCITIWFTSDNTVVRPGWRINITCAPPPPPPAGDCVYTLTMNDSWGDGWGTSFVGVSINGGPYQNYTAAGYGSQVLIGVNIGDVITLNYNNSDPYQNEISYTLMLQGSMLYGSGTSPDPGIVYSASVDCIPPPAPPQDCYGGTTICNGQSFNNNSNNTGTVTDLNSNNQGCLTLGERQGTWYYFSPSSSGTIGFTIDPVGNDDYDYALWGPMTTVSCPPQGQPIRCSYASGYNTNLLTGSYNTGLGNSAADVSEDALGNGWTANLNVIAGQVYILYIDNFSSSGQAFGLSWQLSNGASLDCSILPVELTSFTAVEVEREVMLDWSTASELNSDHYLIERSQDGIDYHVVGSVIAAMNSSSMQNYHFLDRQPFNGVNYYRLQNVDRNGERRSSQVRIVELKAVANAYPNPTEHVVEIVAGADHIFERFQLFDAYGRILSEGSFDQSNERWKLDLRSYSAGTFILHLISSRGERHVPVSNTQLTQPTTTRV